MRLSTLRLWVYWQATSVQALSAEVEQTPLQEQTPHQLQYQHGLNWTDFLYGRIDSQWASRIDKHYKETPPPEKSRLTGHRWTSKLITFIWIQLAGAWKQRNDAQHKKDDGEQSKYRRAEAVRKVRLLYDYKPAVLVFDRAIFDRNLGELLQASSTKQLEDWITTQQPYITAALQDARKHAKRGTQDIRGFFSKDDRPP